MAQSTVDERLPEDETFRSVEIRSDLPLYGFDHPEFWPRSYIPEDAVAGCATRVRFGDWQFTPNPANEFGDVWWLRVVNYGTFHCTAIFRKEYDRALLHEVQTEIGFFARIGEVDRDGAITELWVIQNGAMSGSNYTLLSRLPSDGVAENFSVLQQRCPDGAMRVYEGDLDIISTDYCAINTREDLLTLAIEMLDLPPLGVMARRGESDWEAATEPVEQQPEPADGSFLLESLAPKTQ
ncbi:hypothetical protein [Aurantiacibacter sp. MUD61]|uniref:hypothetical protein n=1 Tax=Aurantiacibacter sp. MUD61 TaxID=3009083 RepID=UPI0022EFE5DA|nr:hypothetical protein [Aurantiacibacter sp. MUD61]